MAGFIRRFPFFPGTEVITAIEGVIIVDQAPPGQVEGGDTGVVAVLGEYADMTFAVKISASGVATTDPRAAEIIGAQDLQDKAGGFDEFLGEFGGSMGNGFVEVRNKRFQRLMIVPVDILTPAAGSQGTLRVWRELPTNQTVLISIGIVPTSAALVQASRQFASGANRARLAARVGFTDLIDRVNATDGSATTAASAVVQVFTSATGNFIVNGVLEGDAVVLGVIGTSINSGTFRVVSVDSATALTVEQQDGAAFVLTTESAIPYRVEPGSNADSGPGANQLSEAAGYDALARPLDATLATGTELTPAVVPPVGTAGSWDSLSGLTAKVHPSTPLTFEAALHAVNAAASATIDARYQAAFDALLSDDFPERDINIVVAARKSDTIRTKMESHVLVASERGLTRRGISSPPINQLTLATVLGDTGNGVGSTRDERLDYAWPGCVTSVPEAVGFSIATSDGKTTSDGLLDVTDDTWLASVESVLPPERNPAQSAPPVPTVLSPVVGFARGTPKLDISGYTQLRARGIVGLRFDKTIGPHFQSGITTSLISGEKNIFRRRMADFLQDAIAARLVQLSKLPLTQQNKDDMITELDAFLVDLQSPDNPSAQRIGSFSNNDVSGNTAATRANNIHVIITKVQLVPTGDFIVLQTDIGTGVVITQALAA
ncbi:hypothetical protein LCGC14_0414770 [marine sediment metagenome]|uniref:Tail sheath protein subtilisin-like domain-containing protein n=1 Tax=marine sediment metagenome TaxID=412755 RepID=A0A0F9TAR9_9ZZZZ